MRNLEDVQDLIHLDTVDDLHQSMLVYCHLSMGHHQCYHQGFCLYYHRYFLLYLFQKMYHLMSYFLRLDHHTILALMSIFVQYLLESPQVHSIPSHKGGKMCSHMHSGLQSVSRYRYQHHMLHMFSDYRDMVYRLVFHLLKVQILTCMGDLCTILYRW